jgi:hypothetical protein
MVDYYTNIVEECIKLFFDVSCEIKNSKRKKVVSTITLTQIQQVLFPKIIKELAEID